MNMAVTKPRQLQDIKEQQEMQGAIRAADLADQLGTAVGRRYVWQVLKNLLYQESITDTNAGVYGKVAKQAVATQMVKEMKSRCRDLFYLMEIENDGLGEK
jgi:hypothetical protein